MVTIDEIAKGLKLLGDSSRLSIAFALEDEAKSVSQIMAAANLSQPLVSFQFRILREAGFVVTKRKDTLVFNSLADPDLPNLLMRFAKYAAG